MTAPRGTQGNRTGRGHVAQAYKIGYVFLTDGGGTADAGQPRRMRGVRFFAQGMKGLRRHVVLGWCIIIYAQTPEEYAGSDTETRKAAVLARWDVGMEGIRWIEDLVEAGKAARLSGGGFPNLYSARAGDVLPLIESGAVKPPASDVMVISMADDGEGVDYAWPADWMDKIDLHADRAAVCSAGSTVTIAAWDLA